jgi:hypothetical protein
LSFKFLFKLLFVFKQIVAPSNESCIF